MNDADKPRAQLVDELAALRRQTIELEAANRRQQIIALVREEVWKMRRSAEMENVLTALWEGMQRLGIPFMYCSINLIDTRQTPPLITVYNINPRKEWRKREFRDHPSPPLLQIWQTQRPSYRPDLHQEDPFGERPTLKVPLRAILDVPFRQGTLAISSTDPHCFSPQDVETLTDLARVLSEGFQRMEDLEQLEQRNQELERELGERRQIEVALQKERDRAQQYLDIAEVILVALDRTGRITLINQKGCRILGYADAELIGCNWFDQCLPARLRESVKEVFAQLVAEELEPVEYFENPVLNRAGEERLIAWHNALLRDPSGQVVGTLSSGQDITQSKRLEQELVRTQRLRAVGELAAGISHNLNNLLTGILGPAQFVQYMTKDREILREVEAVITAGNRARDLVRDLLLSVRGTELQPMQAVDLGQVVRQVIQAMRPRWHDEPQARGTTIELVAHLDDVPPIRGIPSSLRDILTHLLSNAVEAMPQGGTITIATQRAGDGVRLVFSDTGIGMDEETRRRVFEPFFTTKATVGSGLSLSTVYGTVNHWGGRIEVASAPGRGATFTIDLPLWKIGA